MKQTPNLNLNKPEGPDVVNIEDLNVNMDIIDTKLGGTSTGHNHDGTPGNGPKLIASNVNCTATGDVAATNVQAAIAELASEKATAVSVTTVQTNLTNHINDTTAAHVASAISCTATGDVSATDVQSAIAELASEKVSLEALAATTDSASGADKVGATAISGLNGSTVQSLLEALKSYIDSKESTDYGAIGSYVIAASTNWAAGNEYLPGSTVAGSTLVRSSDQNTNTWYSLNGTSTPGITSTESTSLGLSGTWRLLTRVLIGGSLTDKYPLGLLVRIS